MQFFLVAALLAGAAVAQDLSAIQGLPDCGVNLPLQMQASPAWDSVVDLV